jgi:diacylglycerol kinase family enzyme
VRGFLIVNPRSGKSGIGSDELRRAAEGRGIRVHLLQEGDDAAALARSADVEALGAAGGDGSLAAVATVAVERGLPLVCVPFGTRNHFAKDAGLDADDPIGALDGFDGIHRRIDVGRVADRLLLNNVSLGVYAQLVLHRERHRRRREALAASRALWLTLQQEHSLKAHVDGEPMTARVLLVANNAYRPDLFELGVRERLDEGRLHLYATHGLFPLRWSERAGAGFRIELARPSVLAAVDGEPVWLETPLEPRSEPGALRLLVPERARFTT